MVRMMSLRDFRLLFIGTALSLLGDQFTLIATPWLTLQLTGDPLALGLVLALEGIPRAAIMPLGGAITDRFSPRVIMFVADVTRFVLTSLMAFAVLTGTIQIWMLYAFNLGGLYLNAPARAGKWLYLYRSFLMGANSRPQRDAWADDEHCGFLQLWVDARFPGDLRGSHQMES
ncbi:Transmembrane secretion effector [uncultured archaeon]|nr:Transmembrane secretion effector [uncultured archaeon]